MLLFLFALTTTAHATTFEFSCQSYSKEADFEVSVSEHAADFDVIRSTEKGTYALGAQSIRLTPVQTGAGWIAYEGRSARNQEVTFRMQSKDLRSTRVFQANLNVSPDWTDTSYTVNRLDCVRR